MSERPKKLTSEEINSKLGDGWSFDEKANAIVKEFTKLSFSNAAEFIGKIAPIANEQDHHPDILLHDYKKVRIMLSTHDAGGVTTNDFKLAKAIDAL
ncbi:MAG: 4a-hydroxytetrahydrobiopterin dehydratase [Bacteroidota bacterium]|nr:4a-hydroxytetrahydrobiopterin dehydratase [Bacteroidota bacterium]MDP4229177.1 4a-hydroxytetrahydrobiopterin dehydratase [Bacteroidota bacterium]MDP4237747.1 4a-hydroxytetrahydrobiopterin dehydratase [Bacteroidota bacterium]